MKEQVHSMSLPHGYRKTTYCENIQSLRILLFFFQSICDLPTLEIDTFHVSAQRMLPLRIIATGVPGWHSG